ncbi:glycerol kinase GlpK [Alphaproteobacteria bacterium HT1-32]|nr:glycerol kinase GlpK [Alphaproteobacteria bacterium HT1-32]
MTKYVLAIDQGTTSSRAILFDRDFHAIATAQQEFPQHFPDSGWVEHDCGDIWDTVLESCRKAMKQAGAAAGDIAAIGITNQRETTVVWDRRTGEPIHRAIVWQDRRTASICERLRNGGHEVKVAARTGLLLDPYFSGTKIAWILDHVEGARDLAAAGHLAFGTIDCFLIWKLTDGRVHRTDATNASRTLLYNIHDNDWDPELLSLLNIPAGILPEVMDCAADFGETDPDLLGGAIRITGVAGDQQAATVGQACFRPGMLKSTYGTGCFALLNTGQEAVSSHNRLLTTIAYRLDGRTTYALEGSIFVAGAAVQWLRDGLGVIEQARDSDGLAAGADDHQQVYLVPAFTGLGAPHWDTGARGALYGLTRGTGPKELARAALEAVCYQTRDLLEAMYRDWSPDRDSRTVLRVDGGMSASNWTMQFLADILNARVDRPVVMETTALGAAWLAGSHVGFYGDATSFAEKWQLDQRFDPVMDEAVRSRKFAGWQDALRRTLTR